MSVKIYKSGRWKDTTAAYSINYWPIFVDRPISLTRWLINVSQNTSGVNATFRAGIYSSNQQMEPQSLVVELGAETIVASTVARYVNTISPQVRLEPDVYWLAWTVSERTNIFYRALLCTTPMLALNKAPNFNFGRFDTANSSASAGSALPASAPAITGIGLDTTNWGPMFALQWEAV
ncbi:MAG: hypothetical protein RJA16_1041 [Planctomycetota bacterium]